MEETPKTGFNVLLMIEAMVALGVVLAGIFWFAFKLEGRVSALEDKAREEAQSRDAHKRETRIDRLEEALQEQGRLLKQLAPARK